MIPRIREGNDFVFIMPVERAGIPEDLAGIINGKLTVSIFSEKKIVPFVVVDTNKLRVEFNPIICNITGIYNLKFEYALPDLSLSDSERQCAVDVDAFEIVGKSAQASDGTEFSVTVDMAIGFQGKSAYAVWLETHEGTQEDYETFLRQPAIDAAELAQEVADHPDKIVLDYWHKWNTELKEYENTGIKAKGDTGPMPELVFGVNENGELNYTITN